MKKISEGLISKTVSRLCIEANMYLRTDVKAALQKAFQRETNARAKRILSQLLENAEIARTENVALCQDTGLPVVFVDIGRGVDLFGIDMVKAVNRGIEHGYRRGFLRESIVSDPLRRDTGSGFTPCLIHFDFSRRNGLKLTVLPKGFGCENKTKLVMFNPTAPHKEIEDFIVSVVKEAGPDACPPYVIGVGIGGAADTACRLSKEALLRPIHRRSAFKHVASMEERLLKRTNHLRLGPMGLGGKATVLGVNILTHATHIAGLPVCVNVSCHALRSASAHLR